MLLTFMLAASTLALVHCHSTGRSQSHCPSYANQMPRLQKPFRANDSLVKVPSPPLEVQALKVTGSQHNRVDLVFFSDGYTESERQKFFDDALTLTNEITINQTFSTVLPVMNFWAAFTASAESGVGTGGKPKDTVYGLYRDGTELRAVYYDKPEVGHAACDSLEDQCDYPILLGNDPYYGGLGGEFTVITSSPANGPLILRHELGHSVIEVGEEYDGGFAYFGPNAAQTVDDIPWTQWLTSPPPSGELPRVERSIMPMQAYPWTLLNTTTAWSVSFDSAGTYGRHLVRTSLSGLLDGSDLRIELDGEALGWEPHPGIGLDRYFYDISKDKGLSGGSHNLSFTLLNPDLEGMAQLCSAEILEYGTEEEFISIPGYYGVYPTFSDQNETTYRPTNEDCLMRLVTSAYFCKACIEGLWISLLSRVSLIDSVGESCDGSSKVLNLSLVSVAQFRDPPTDKEESYLIIWSKDGQELTNFENSTQLVLDEGQVGVVDVEVTFVTEEVRVDKNGTLTDAANYTVTSECA